MLEFAFLQPPVSDYGQKRSGLNSGEPARDRLSFIIIRESIDGI